LHATTTIDHCMVMIALFVVVVASAILVRGLEEIYLKGGFYSGAFRLKQISILRTF
jgi:hypothetical protein